MAFLADEAFGYLQRSHVAGRLGHAYLITGEEGSGKERLVLLLLRLLNGARAEKLEAVRDEQFHLIKPESKLRRIKVEQIRRLEGALQYTGRPGAAKIGVIVEADRLQRESENAFLKTLEEPPPGTLLLLLTEQPERLLETIRSRCIRVPLRPAPGQSVRLPERHRAFLDALAKHFLAGKPTLGAALSLARRFIDILREEREAVTRECEAALRDEQQRYAQTTDGNWLKHRETFHKDQVESEYARRRSALVETLSRFLGDILRRGGGLSHLDFPEYANAIETAARRPFLTVQQQFASIETLRGHLETTVMDQLAVEVAFLKAFGPRRGE